jgi:hypothetical protein
LSEKLANKTLIPIYLQEFTYTDNNPCCHWHLILLCDPNTKVINLYLSYLNI